MTKVRVNGDGGLVSPGLNSDADFAELLFGFSSTGAAGYTTTANPTAELLSTAQNANVSLGQSSGATPLASNGTITIARPGLYLVYLSLGELDTASASGIITVEVQKNSAAITSRMRSKSTLGAGASTFSGNLNSFRVVSLTRGDTIRAVVTGTVGGVITLTDGCLGVVQLTDTGGVTRGE